ncbi:hypothetical protein DFH28DRAFT_1127009 [Melampsora americana]|nr:hypothetical protein DFH28DRAFT_1127009 [Melampsora americana]
MAFECLTGFHEHTSSAGRFEDLMPNKDLDECAAVGIDLLNNPPEVAEDGDSQVEEDEWEDGGDEGLVMAHAAATEPGPEEPW